MAGEGFVIAGVVFAAVGATATYYAEDLARVDRKFSLGWALTGRDDPPGWYVAAYRALAVLAAGLGLLMVAIGLALLFGSPVR